jgi:hypothetical protein
MENLLKKGIQALFQNSIPFKPLRYHLCIPTSNPSSPNINLFFLLPKDFPLLVVFMIIPFLSSLGSLPPNVCPYHHPFSHKNEIEKIVQEFITVGVIHP